MNISVVKPRVKSNESKIRIQSQKIRYRESATGQDGHEIQESKSFTLYGDEVTVTQVFEIITKALKEA